MRSQGWVAVCLLAAAGCQTENEMRYTATLQAETNGFVLTEDGQDAVAAMSGTTCTVDASWGCPTADANLPTTAERVVDNWRGTTLGTSDLGLHTIRAGEWVTADDEAMVEVRNARLYQGGRVVVHGHAGACLVQRNHDAGVAVDDALCDPATRVFVDRATGDLVAATPNGAWKVDERGAAPIPGASDLVAWDAELGLVYLATTGENGVRAVDTSGAIAWKVETTGKVTGLAERGNRHELLVRVSTQDGMAAIERRDGVNGELLGRSRLPNDDGDITVSDDGKTVALIRLDEVVFFELLTDEDEPTVDATPVTCITPTIDGGTIPIGD